MLLFASLLLLGTAVGVGLRFASAAPAPWVSLPQSVAPQVASAKLTGALNGAQHMQISVTLQSKNETTLKAYANDVGKPKAKAYHRYITPAQFAIAFGADHSKLNAVEKYFQSQGLHLDSAISGGLFLQFSGSVAQVETALHTQINTYHGADGRTFFANANALQLPRALAPSIIDVSGTENARVSHPASAVAPGKTSANVARSSVKRASVVHPNWSVTCPTAPTFSGASAPYTATGLLPTQLNNSYNFQNTTNPGNGMWAAFIEMDGFSLDDLTQYANCIGLSSTIQNAISGSGSGSSPFIITQNVSNGTGDLFTTAGQTSKNFGTPLTPGSNALAVEEELETFLGLVPNVGNITVMQTANTVMGIQTAMESVAMEDAAQVVGYQWGMCEPDLGFSNASAEQQILLQMVLQGQSVLAATGNNGLYACSGDGNSFRQFSFNVQDPASQPFVTAVGGSELTFTTNVAGTAQRATEQPWLTNTVGVLQAGGGGISQFWAAPAWQQNSGAALTFAPPHALTGVETLYNPETSNLSATPSRVIPDVSAAADINNSSVAIYCSVGSCSNHTTFTNAGGTTEAEAIWSAATIEAAQTSMPTLPSVGGRPGLITPALYALYQQDTTQITPYLALGVNFCDYANQLGVSAFTSTFSTAVGLGLDTVVPASMTGIVNGMNVTIGGDGPTAVSAVTATSFQGTVGASEAAGTTITPTVSTEATALIAGGADAVVTPHTGTVMAGIVTGEDLLVDGGAAGSEVVSVLSTTLTTFTAHFLNPHAANVTIVGTFATPSAVPSTNQVTTELVYQVGSHAGPTAVTPASMTNIVVGSTIDVGITSQVVSAVGSTYFVTSYAFDYAVGQAFSGGGHALAGAATGFALPCTTAGNFALNDALPISTSLTNVTEYYPSDTTHYFQQAPGSTTAIDGNEAGFGVLGASPSTYDTGYNALTGLGSPNVGNTTIGSGQLLAYLTAQAKYSVASVYMVAQGQSDGKYWIGNFATNPYVPNMPTNTAWFSLNSVAFSGNPVVVDDGNANPGNLLILGPAMPTATGLAMYDWNIASGTANQVSLTGGNLPGAYAGSTSSCASISAISDGSPTTPATSVGVYCVTASGALYSTDIVLDYTGDVVTSGAPYNWTNSPLLNSVADAPQVAADNSSDSNYLVLEQDKGASGVHYQYFNDPNFADDAGVVLFPYAVGATSGSSPFSFPAPLGTSCLTTPSAAFVAASNLFAIACTASDTKAMWANVYIAPNGSNGANGQFNPQWSLLGQPSSSVTFTAGNAVTVDNYATDQSYGQVFYIAEGTDRAMYIDMVNAAASNFLGKYANQLNGWISISLPGVFNSASSADFIVPGPALT